MDGRKRKVLHAIILDYIATADPVGSRTIAKKYNLGVSPATVRNEMADLEEMGLLEQPYTSAGRIPSQLGYRYYVDSLMIKETLPADIKEVIRGALMSRVKETESLIQLSSKLLSQLTNYTALIMAPYYAKSTLRYIQLLPVEENKAVIIVVLDNGHVEHCIVDVPDLLAPEDFTAISHILNERLRGLALEQWKPSVLKSIYAELKYQKKVLNNIIEIIENSLAVDHDNRVFLGGTLNILNQPEFKDINKVKGLLSLLEEAEIIKDILQGQNNEGTIVKIGTENTHEGMKDCSLITTTYELDGEPIGTIGILGPTRMEYSKAISIVEFLTKALTEGLRNI